jgi:hypothetical protein
MWSILTSNGITKQGSPCYMSKPVWVFVSHHHSSEEDAFTALLVYDSECAGGDVWVDSEGITSGSFVHKINEGPIGRQWWRRSWLFASHIKRPTAASSMDRWRRDQCLCPQCSSPWSVGFYSAGCWVSRTTKLTTERLDAVGCRWTMRRQQRQIQASVGYRRTTLDSAPSARKSQGAGLISISPAP